MPMRTKEKTLDFHLFGGLSLSLSLSLFPKMGVDTFDRKKCLVGPCLLGRQVCGAPGCQIWMSGADQVCFLFRVDPPDPWAFGGDSAEQLPQGWPESFDDLPSKWRTPWVLKRSQKEPTHFPAFHLVFLRNWKRASSL